MIAYCPLEDLEPPPQRRPEVAVAPSQKAQPEKADEDTELNYVILAFIVGVVLLAISDSMKK